jgi:predicted metal-dependent phosphoesterase TrpH
MTLRYDLHSHSTASDGTLTPTELVRRAHQHGVDVLALTDHDCVTGLTEAIAAAHEEQISLLPGIELSATWASRTIHIVGLDIDFHNRQLLDGCKAIQSTRIQRAEEMARRLGRKGIPDALNGARKFAGAGNITRTHFARYLVELGKANSVSDVFNRYLVPNKPGYVKTQWAELEEAVAWIVSAGGQAVIAHPGRYKLTSTKMRALLGDFVDCGGTGLEVVYSGCDRGTVESNAHFARQFGLKASAGSDFHNPGIPWIELGKLPPLPRHLDPVWVDGFRTITR